MDKAYDSEEDADMRPEERRPPVVPDNEDSEEYYRRRRAKSEANTEMTKGRLVAAWTSFKKSWEIKRLNEDVSNTETNASSKDGSRRNEGHHAEHYGLSNASSLAERTVSTASHDLQNSSRPRKVVSLLFRRRRRARGLNVEDHRPNGEHSDDGDMGASGDSWLSTAKRDSISSAKRARFRRVRSQLNPPVANAAAYAAYAAELDDNSFNRLREFTKEIASQRRRVAVPSTAVSSAARILEGDANLVAPIVSGLSTDEENDAIIGEICLEDFADGSSEDFDFLDDPNVDYSTSRRPSLKMDNQRVTWIGNESDFQAFFADFGLDDILDDVDLPEHDITDFNIAPDVLSDWEKAVQSHNEVCQGWEHSYSEPPDIRSLVDDFMRLRSDCNSERSDVP